eukprot:CAMPEP_0175415716 /NCGR_PEP_ID=MMETSP0095-20121207/44318_1 /TAXON_ID=311494 /ORGANISM="Alexandrium monilatum, Strain CCMP3105" /LENGTH=42 /DNA_ID= /DNA_START= /DNA_END= /DNA_ORIENTATION=
MEEERRQLPHGALLAGADHRVQGDRVRSEAAAPALVEQEQRP